MPELIESLLDKPVVLLVEADAAEAALVLRAFEQAAAGVRLLVECEPEAALARLREMGDDDSVPRPQLILLGVAAPGDGIAALVPALKADPELRRTPVVVFTRLESEAAVHELYDLRGNAFVVKAPEFGAFVEQVRALHRYWFKTVSLTPR